MTRRARRPAGASGPGATGVTVVPANETSWEDVQAVFGARGYASRCRCQRYKIGNADWTPVPMEERALRLRMETGCGDPRAETTSGLVAYLDGEPAGWCAVEPRTAYPRLTQQVVWKGRSEDMGDEGVWAVTC
ncbi:MAG TPA: GNAT family N-acetyltransferase, partial [Chloroflexota bacterium]|nr:GNAT family N-acetyltransferase [Chloroflexota bacterium]